MPYAISTRGARIHYSVTGEDGPTVVLVQGLGLSSRFWFDLPRRLVHEATPRNRVIVLDNRGVGRSERTRGRLSIAQMADDVAAVLGDAGAGAAYVVGISLGGMIAQEVALRHPARVRGLVLLATTPGLPHGIPPGPAALARLVALGFKRARGGQPLSNILLPKHQQAQAAEILREWPAAMRAETVHPRDFFAQLGAAVGHSTGFRLKQIACPTVVVGAGEDVVIPARNSRAIAARIPGAELEILRDCAHGIPLTDELVVHRALDRIRAIEARRSSNGQRARP
jgi:3-oxoadipate enol-lactonase